jgi:hypothetical protein
MLILLLFIDDTSKKVLDFPIKRKDEVLGTLLKFHMIVERKTNKLLRCNVTDNGGEYFSKSFEDGSITVSLPINTNTNMYDLIIAGCYCSGR